MAIVSEIEGHAMVAQLATPAVEHSLADAMRAASLNDGVINVGAFLPEDLGRLFAWLNDPQAARWDQPYRPVDCVAYKDWLDRLSSDHSQVLFGIRKSAVPQCIGFLQFKNFHPVHRAAELSIRIGAECDRGQGLGTRAIRLALAYAWNTLNLHRVSLTVFANNSRAIACYRNVGFREEGVMRDAVFIEGKWLDVVAMAILHS